MEEVIAIVEEAQIDFSEKKIEIPGINAVGSFTPDMQEIDSDIVIRADKIVTDNMNETWEVAGDLLVPLKNGEITRSRIHGNVGDIITGKVSGRETDQEITIYESVGNAALDIALAIKIYERMIILDV
jgi:ornithine cyclodeaminase/alanine dehydrogenase-like protein (mu-crystallin family)